MTISERSARRRAIGTLVLFTAAVVSGCTFTTVLPLQATVEAPTVAPVPLAVGVHYSAEFRGYEYVRARGRHVFVAPLGQASLPLLDAVFPRMFKEVVQVPQPPPLADDGPALAAVIEPRIEEADFNHPLVVVSMADVTATVTYRLTVWSTRGDPVASWTVTGIGRPSPGWFVWGREPYSKAMELALADAAQKLMTGFRRVPEVRGWLEKTGVPDAG